MQVKNIEIYNFALNYNKAFSGFNQYLPVKINFYLQKNIKVLMEAYELINARRTEIITNYGKPTEDGTSIAVAPENIEAANAEILELMEIEQEISITPIPLSSFDETVAFTPEQMAVIMFMIEE